MTIIRSSILSDFMRDKLFKGKRKRVDWHRMMIKLGNAEIEHDFCLRLGRLYRGHSMSVRRCAYNALKNYYSTTTIDELLAKCEADL